MDLVSDQKEFEVGCYCNHVAYGIVKILCMNDVVFKVKKIHSRTLNLPDEFFAFKKHLKRLSSLEKELL